MTDIKITSWNMGTDVNDYKLRLPEFHAADADKLKLAPLIENDFDGLHAIAAEKLFSDKTAIGSVVMLQEHKFKTAGTERAEVEKLKNLNYEIRSAPTTRAWGPDISIAIDRDRFEIVSQEARNFENGSKALIVFAEDKESHRTIAFVSVAVTGSTLLGKRKEIKDGAKLANEDCKALIAWVKDECKRSDVVCIGGDFNANPEKLPSRFALFAKAGFKLSRTKSTTELNYDQGMSEAKNNYNKRELDFFLVKDQSKSIMGKIKSIFSRRIVNQKATTYGRFADHGSDHMPIQSVLHVRSKKVRKQKESAKDSAAIS